MPEPTVDDVIAYTNGTLADDDETARMLAAALAAARTYCRWPVTPVVTDDVVTLDGPADQLLALPTMQLVDLTELTENGVAADVDTLLWQPAPVGRPVRATVYKPFGAYWTGCRGEITVTMTHGFDTADDFNAAVLDAVARMATAKSRADPALIEKRVADVDYRWSETVAAAIFDESLLGPYRLVSM